MRTSGRVLKLTAKFIKSLGYSSRWENKMLFQSWIISSVNSATRLQIQTASGDVATLARAWWQFLGGPLPPSGDGSYVSKTWVHFLPIPTLSFPYWGSFWSYLCIRDRQRCHEQPLDHFCHMAPVEFFPMVPWLVIIAM